MEWRDGKKLNLPHDLPPQENNGILADAGSKIGVEAIGMIGAGIASAAGSIKATVVAVGTKATAVGSAVVASPFTPWVVGGVVVGGVGYKTYRYFKPTQETIDKQKEAHTESEKKQAENIEKAERAKRDAEKSKTETIFEKCMRRRAGSVQKFSDYLSRNRRSVALNAHGFPVECEDDAYSLSLEEDGDNEVLKLAKRHIMFAPIEQNKKPGDKD